LTYGEYSTKNHTYNRTENLGVTGITAFLFSKAQVTGDRILHVLA
jgi:hypothetical protein